MAARVTIELEHSEALILWDFFMRVDDAWVASAQNSKVEIYITDMADMRALWRTKANLDYQITEMFEPDYDELVATAQHELGGQAGDWPTES